MSIIKATSHKLSVRYFVTFAWTFDSIVHLGIFFTPLVVHAFCFLLLFQIQTIYNSSRSNNKPSEIDIDQFR